MKLEFLDFEYAEARKRSNTFAESMNINVDVTDAKFEDNSLSIAFNYTVAYSDQSYIRISGKARFSGADAKTAFNEWEKTKRITGTPGEQIVNAINYSASINSIFIARIFNLTPPIVPPTIIFKQKEKGRKG